MKKTILILILPILSWSQDFSFVYEYSFIKDTLSTQVEKEQYYLFEQDSNYLFVGDYYFFLDSLEHDRTRLTPTPNLSQIRGKSNRDRSTLKTIVQKPNNETIFFKNLFNKIKVKYTDYVPLDWKISKDTLTYLNYPAKKAYTTYGGRKYTAIFTMEIPITTGPYVFRGLPGLILAIEDEDKHHVLELIEIQKMKKNIIFQQYSDVSKKEFQNILENVKKNPIPFLLPNSNLNDEMKNKLKEKTIEKNKRDNNPIELLDN